MTDASLDDDEKPAEGAEGAEGGEVEDGEGGGKSKKKLIIIIAAAVVVLLGGGAGLYFTGMLDSLLGKEAPAEGEHGEAHADGEGHSEVKYDDHGNPIITGGPVFLEIPDIIVNLSSSDSNPRYLRLKVQLEFENEEDKVAVEQVMPRVVDQFQTYLRELRVRDLRGSAGIYRLQMELLSRVNAAAYPVQVQDVLFQEILIQ